MEYHILGNHLLENGYALLFGAYYFGDKKLYEKAYQIVSEELEEQILEDGAHFELSPMYHQILLNRLLDCIYLVNSNIFLKDDLEFEMVIADDGKTWVNFWGDWKGTMAANNKELIIPIHLTVQIVNDKIVEEHGYYNLSEYMANMQEIANTKAVEEKTEDE